METVSTQPEPATTESTPPAKVPLEEQGHLSRTQLYIIAAVLSIAVLGLVGYIIWNYIQTDDTTSTQSSPTTTEYTGEETEELTVPDIFCGDAEYCSVNETCSDLQENHGVCSSEEECEIYYLCGRGEELLDFGMETLFSEYIQSYDRTTKIGYLLIRNTEATGQSTSVTQFECLNYEGLCDDFVVTFPTSFLIPSNDTVVFPVYLERQEPLIGLASLEFSFQIGDKTAMISIDVIFNDDKTCIYQWGGLDKSRRGYFDEPSVIDWTQHCK